MGKDLLTTNVADRSRGLGTGTPRALDNRVRPTRSPAGPEGSVLPTLLPIERGGPLPRRAASFSFCRDRPLLATLASFTDELGKAAVWGGRPTGRRLNLPVLATGRAARDNDRRPGRGGLTSLPRTEATPAGS